MTHLQTANNTSVAASVAPEDLRCGDYVSVLNEIVEFPSFLWCDSMPSERHELVRIRCHSADSGALLKVKAICLPFVFVKAPLGRRESLDIRKVQLVRVEERYAKTVWKAMRKQRSRRKGKKKGR